MLIVVTSDCHGNKEILNNIYLTNPNADLYLDAGDSECQEDEIFPFITVKGNCDRYIFEKSRVIEIANIKIYLFHGNQIPLSLDSLVKLAKANNCKIIIHGHTHIPLSIEHDGINVICPGSVTYPRSTKGPTYCLIKLNNEKVDEIEFHRVQYDSKS